MKTKTMVYNIEQIGKTKFIVMMIASIGILLAGCAPPTHGAGLLVADGGFGGKLKVVEHDVNVVVNNGIAVTEVNQIFENLENRQVEALYTFPVPKDASVSNFSMWINGKEMIGEVVEKKKAREIYESYKRRGVDPGLLEQVDYKTFEMRIFPIPAKGKQRVRLTYYQELEMDHDWMTFVYPLSTVSERPVDSRVEGTFSFDLDIKSALPIRSIESPSHRDDVAFVKHTDLYQQASLELANGELSRDIVVAIQAARQHTGMDLVTSKVSGDDGYFLASISVGKDLEAIDAGMDYLFILDSSGSMANDRKLVISQESVEAFVEVLGKNHRFDIMTFNIRPNTMFNHFEKAGDTNLARAKEFLSTQQARGGTMLMPALQTALRYVDEARQMNIIILSDGMTAQKERSALIETMQCAPKGVRAFCIGVGNDVNKPLLEELAKEAGGLASFISAGDDFKRRARLFRSRLTRPVATDLVLTINGVEVYDMEPATIGNLYYGKPIKVYGRYEGEGKADVTLAFKLQGNSMDQTVELEFPKLDSKNPELERMWASKRVDRLVKEIDKTSNKTRLIDKVVMLGEGYSIASKYTSFLVLENNQEYARWKIDQRNAMKIERDRTQQLLVRTRLDSLRSQMLAQAIDGLGPTDGIKAKPKPVVPRQVVNRVQNNQSPQVPATRTPRSQSRDFKVDFGTGPVGLPFLLSLFWMRRKKKSAGYKQAA